MIFLLIVAYLSNGSRCWLIESIHVQALHAIWKQSLAQKYLVAKKCCSTICAFMFPSSWHVWINSNMCEESVTTRCPSQRPPICSVVFFMSLCTLLAFPRPIVAQWYTWHPRRGGALILESPLICETFLAATQTSRMLGKAYSVSHEWGVIA
jgi:hypothetical protein